MFYNHPPGAADHLNPINALLTRGDRLEAEGKFKWYTMARIADFSRARLATTWSTSIEFELVTTFTASHPDSLRDMTWLLPRDRFTPPWLRSGDASVSSDDTYWIVTAEGGYGSDQAHLRAVDAVCVLEMRAVIGDLRMTRWLRAHACN